MAQGERDTNGTEQAERARDRRGMKEINALVDHWYVRTRYTGEPCQPCQLCESRRSIQSWTLPLDPRGPDAVFSLSPCVCRSSHSTYAPQTHGNCSSFSPSTGHLRRSCQRLGARQDDPAGEQYFPPIMSLLGQLRREASQVLPNLFLSSAFTARWGDTLDRLKITHIISVLEEPVTFPKTARPLKLLHIPASDNVNTDLLCFMDQTTEFIKEAIGPNKQERDQLERASLGDITEEAEDKLPTASGQEQENRVLVHCLAGMSRSVTIVIAYLLATTPMTTEEATEFVRSKRSIIRPNYGFIKQLEQYERRHFVSAGKTNKPKRRVESGIASRVRLYQDVAMGVRRDVE